MELVNEVNRYLSREDGPKEDLGWSVVKEAVEATVVLLSPVTPHITEELWQMLGHSGSLLTVPWPTYREEALEVDKKLIVIQVNGKVRGRMEVPSAWDDERIEQEALGNERVKSFVGQKPVRRVIVVQHKLVNVVV
jgi:leucyl-tRNA synthetase